MDHELTGIVCIVDRSGSMDSMVAEAIGGFNAFLEDQKKEPGRAEFTLVLFDHEYAPVCICSDIQEVVPLDGKTYVPRGTTALNDAVGRTLVDVGKNLENRVEDQRPGKVIVMILTDGRENASTDFSAEKVKEMTQHQQEKYGWEFLYLAAGQDAMVEGGKLGIAAKRTSNFAPTGEGVSSSYLGASCSVSQFRRTGGVGDLD